MGKFVPGNPAFVVENMPGAGHLIGANHVYKVAKPDGLTLGHFQGGLFLHQVFGRPGIEFDAKQFELIGSPIKESRACAFTKASGITSVEKWLASKTPVKLGGIGGAAPDDIARMLAATTALPIQLVAGYKGTAEIRLAAEAGEVAGGCWQWESIKSIWRQGLDSGNVAVVPGGRLHQPGPQVAVVLQVNAQPHPELAKVPNAIDFATTENSKLLLKFGGHDPSAITRPYAVAPGTAKDRVQMLRKAFVDSLKDPEFIADAKKSRLDTDPLTGEEIEKIVGQLFKMNASLVNQLKEILN